MTVFVRCDLSKMNNSNRKLSQKDLYEIACRTGYSFLTTLNSEEVASCLDFIQAEEAKRRARLSDNVLKRLD
jgi:hypothetical protein